MTLISYARKCVKNSLRIDPAVTGAAIPSLLNVDGYEKKPFQDRYGGTDRENAYAYREAFRDQRPGVGGRTNTDSFSMKTIDARIAGEADKQIYSLTRTFT
jgi:hypothetical protein